MSLIVGPGKRERDKWLDADKLAIVGKKLSTEEQSIANRLFLAGLAEADVETRTQIVTGIATGFQGQATVMEVPAYVCMTKAKKEVTVTSTEAMKIIIENGGEFLAETTKELKL
jgi:hypothetical protein